MSQIHNLRFTAFIAQVATPIAVKEEVALFMVTIDKNGFLMVYKSDGTSDDTVMNIMKQCVTKGSAKGGNKILRLN